MRLLRTLIVIMLLMKGCSLLLRDNALPEPYTELVLQEYAQLVFDAKEGPLKITAGKNLERNYEWDGCGLDADMFPRKKNRWYGSFGAYDAAGEFFFDAISKKKCGGVSRTVVEEGQLHFRDEVGVKEWLNHLPKYMDTHFTNDGVVLTRVISPQRAAINVDLFQICIDGKKPLKLEGAQDNLFHWYSLKEMEEIRFECTQVTKDVMDLPKWSNN